MSAPEGGSGAAVPAPFELPPYPYDRLGEIARIAGAHPGGAVDCSVGTPCDPPPEAALSALAASPAVRGYPPAIGSEELRRAASGWLGRRFGVEVAPTDVAACVGTKELVASVPHLLRLRDPGRDTVLYPAISYPTYAMGASLAWCRAVPVPPRSEDDGTPDLAAVDPEDVRRALLVWVNSPANPSGQLTDLATVAGWGREHGVPVFSDECYAEFTWNGPPRSILEQGSAGVVAVHSLSKRSNLAGLRAGFVAGDTDLVRFLREVRRHAGLMVPGPVQAAAAAALDDDEHVELQRARYRERLSFVSKLLDGIGCPTTMPPGGFYLWPRVPAPYRDAWELARFLARAGGMLTSPGDFYGPEGADHLRVAVVQPMERLELVAERLASAGPPGAKPQP